MITAQEARNLRVPRKVFLELFEKIQEAAPSSNELIFKSNFEIFNQFELNQIRSLGYKIHQEPCCHFYLVSW